MNVFFLWTMGFLLAIVPALLVGGVLAARYGARGLYASLLLALMAAVGTSFLINASEAPNPHTLNLIAFLPPYLLAALVGSVLGLLLSGRMFRKARA